jgi:predicted double-glycine peptidase
LKDFVAAIVRTIKVRKKTKILTEQAHGNKSLKRAQIFQNIKEIKEGKTQLIRGIPTHQKNKHNEDIVATAADPIEENRRQTVLGLTSALRKI